MGSESGPGYGRGGSAFRDCRQSGQMILFGLIIGVFGAACIQYTLCSRVDEVSSNKLSYLIYVSITPATSMSILQAHMNF